jgi:hypothetical protein
MSGADAAYAVVASARRLLGDDLVAAFLLGCLAHADFVPGISDVEVALVVADVDDRASARITEVRGDAAAHAADPEPHEVRVHWSSWQELGTRAPRGSFPAMQRYDLMARGVPLVGDDRRRTLRLPDPDALEAQNVSRARALLTDPSVVRLVRRPDRLGTASPRVVVATVLGPVRALHAHRVGHPGSVRGAVAWYERRSDAAAPDLVAAAARYRAAGGRDVEPVVAAATARLHALHDELAEVRGT